jgi:hypothetical protein
MLTTLLACPACREIPAVIDSSRSHLLSIIVPDFSPTQPRTHITSTQIYRMRYLRNTMAEHSSPQNCTDATVPRNIALRASFVFLELPPELRIQVYGHILEDVFQCPIPPRLERNRGLVLSCMQIKHEIEEEYVKAFNSRIQSLTTGSGIRPLPVTGFLDSMHLRIFVSAGWESAATDAALQAIFPIVQYFTMRPNSSFAQLNGTVTDFFGSEQLECFMYLRDRIGGLVDYWTPQLRVRRPNLAPWTEYRYGLTPYEAFQEELILEVYELILASCGNMNELYQNSGFSRWCRVTIVAFGLAAKH